MQVIGLSQKVKLFNKPSHFKLLCASYFELSFSVIFFNPTHVQVLTLKLKGLQSRKMHELYGPNSSCYLYFTPVLL